MIRTADGPSLLVDGRLRPWSLTGYGSPEPAPTSGQVEVLTPPSIVAAISAGYRPLIHPTALAGTDDSGWEQPAGLRGQLRRRPNFHNKQG
jgi:hypothetical protein